MAIPDINGLDAQELMELLDKAGQLYSQRRSNAQSNLAGARAALNSLIGADKPTAPSMKEQVARILRDVLTVVR